MLDPASSSVCNLLCMEREKEGGVEKTLARSPKNHAR